MSKSRRGVREEGAQEITVLVAEQMAARADHRVLEQVLPMFARRQRSKPQAVVALPLVVLVSEVLAVQGQAETSI